MKTLLKYESKIQEVTVLLFIITLITQIWLGNDVFSKILIIEFFALAIVQYTLNSIKFFNDDFTRNDSRKLYMFLSTFVVIGFLLWRMAFIFGWNSLENISAMMALSWVFLTPLLIFQSLWISWFDFKNKVEKQDLID
ncbi:MAG: hypothetical protein K0R36_1916 [Chryseobacterium sp.]|jgi:hypothetical protein|nr:hypothetical protein [Chryseobacterium sp.]